MRATPSVQEFKRKQGVREFEENEVKRSKRKRIA
jgi:hypothetical protein